MFIPFILILTSLTAEQQAVILPIPEYALQNVHADQETVRHDFLLLETLLYDFLNIFTRPVEIVHLNKSFDKNIRTTKGKNINTTTPINEEAKIVEELTNALKELPVSTIFEQKKFHDFIKSMTKIGMGECVRSLAKLIDSAADALLATTYCHLTGRVEAHVRGCLGPYLSSGERSAQILDAWGRPPAGIFLSGPFFWLGAYDQCLSLSLSDHNQSVQYCRADVRVKAYGLKRRIPLFYGMCLPARCTESNVHEAFSITSRFLKKTLGIAISGNSAVECYQQNISFFKKFGMAQVQFLVTWFLEISTGLILEHGIQAFQWTVLVMLMLLVLLVFFGTLTDFYRKRHHKKYLVNKETSTSLSQTIRLATSARSILSDMSSKCTPCVQDDAKSFIYTDAPSHALTYKSAPAVRRTLKKWSCFVNTILAFSARSTYHYLMRPTKRHLNSLHGIRVLSALWVVIGHAHLLSLEYVGNVRELWSSVESKGHFSQIIFNSSIAVDSFLLISGTVLAYKIHSRIAYQRHQKAVPRSALSLCGWIALYMHRITRLIPAYLITLLVIYYIFQHIGDGPMWSQQNGVFGARCDSSDIWRQLLFLSNFYPNECMPWMWYLALDTQFYIIAPIALIFLHNAPTAGTTFIFIIVLLSVLYRVTVTILFRFPTTLTSALMTSDGLATQSLEKLFKYLYAAPQARIGPFLIGMVLGWSLATKPKRAWSILHIDIARFLSFVMLTFSLFGAQYADEHNVFSIFYSATFRTFWASGLALLVWLGERGYMPPIHSCLAWNKWVLFSRLSYGFYLWHEPILLYFIWTRRSAMMPFSSLYFIVFAIEISVLSLLAAAITAFIVEVPPLIIERKIFKRIRARASSNAVEEQRAVANESDDGSATIIAEQQFERKSKNQPELVPMLPPMCRTKRWIEENHNDKLRNREFTGVTGNLKHMDYATARNDRCKYYNESNTAAAANTASSSVSTCKSLSEKSTNGMQNFQSAKPLRTPNPASVAMRERRQQLRNLNDDAKGVGITAKHHVVKNPTVNQTAVQKLRKPTKEKPSRTAGSSEDIGFSWIEKVEKRLDAEENASPRSLQYQTKKITFHDPVLMCQYQQLEQQYQRFPHSEQLSPIRSSDEDQSSNSSSNGETVVHVFKHKDLNESNL